MDTEYMITCRWLIITIKSTERYGYRIYDYVQGIRFLHVQATQTISLGSRIHTRTGGIPIPTRKELVVIMITFAVLSISALGQENSASYWVKKGAEFYQNGSYDLAEKCFDKLLSKILNH
jgi:hypothetical protein